MCRCKPTLRTVCCGSAECHATLTLGSLCGWCGPSDEPPTSIDPDVLVAWSAYANALGDPASFDELAPRVQRAWCAALWAVR